ncbi:hypothetical protein LXL04_007076 [Taraxacum kok-saghyz]
MLNRINSRLYRPSISSTHSWILDAQLLKGGQCLKLKQAQYRNHIVEGILIGLDNIDDVIDVIRKATSNSVASTDLRKNMLFIVMQRNKYVNEGKSLTKQISNLEELLSSRKQTLQVIEQEANEIKNKFSTPRQSNKSKIQ